MSTPELKPCPFCGGEAEATNYVVEAAVSCTQCRASIVREHGQYDDTGCAKAIAAWNRRADLCDPMQDERVKALVAAVKALVAALNHIDALDPEDMVYGCTPDALRGLVIRMGQFARAALRDMGVE
jgi:Lar family restriction alleviation protein